MIPSPEQQAIIDEVLNTNNNIIVRARAGTGKTSTIKLILQHLPSTASAIYLVFNSRNAKEFDGPIKASTFHSLGFAPLRRKLPNIKLDANKLRNILQRRMSDAAEFKMYSTFVTRLTSFAKGLDPNSLTDNSFPDLVNHHNLTLDDEEASISRAIELSQKLYDYSIHIAHSEQLIDFDDQLLLPVLWNLSIPKVDFVIIDEAQDTSPIRRLLAANAIRPDTGRVIAVGDDRQAIYGFTGASHDALDAIASIFNAVTLPLTTCFRCASSVVQHATSFVPDIRSPANALQGNVTFDASYKNVIPTLTSRDAIICRNTAPLIPIAYHLISKDIPCQIRGRDIGKSLITLLEKISTRGVDNLLNKLSDWQSKQLSKLQSPNDDKKIEAINDKVDCLRFIIDSLPTKQRTVPAITAKITALFSDENNDILTLSTIHSSKGLEFEQVIIHAPELMPSKYATKPHQILEEENLHYVAITRAKQHLIYMKKDHNPT